MQLEPKQRVQLRRRPPLKVSMRLKKLVTVVSAMPAALQGGRSTNTKHCSSSPSTLPKQPRAAYEERETLDCRLVASVTLRTRSSVVACCASSNRFMMYIMALLSFLSARLAFTALQMNQLFLPLIRLEKVPNQKGVTAASLRPRFQSWAVVRIQE